jgi:hypothetical protein
VQLSAGASLKGWYICGWDHLGPLLGSQPSRALWAVCSHYNIKEAVQHSRVILCSIPETKVWQPPISLPPQPHSCHPLFPLAPNQSLELIKNYSQIPQSTPIMHLANRPTIHLKSQDLHELLTHNFPINHELITMVIIRRQYKSTYLEPSFFPLLPWQGWPAIKNWFSPHAHEANDTPSLVSKSILLPIHINGNHWVATCQWIINGSIFFIIQMTLTSHP